MVAQESQCPSSIRTQFLEMGPAISNQAIGARLLPIELLAYNLSQ
jgi:hypothetical protein